MLPLDHGIDLKVKFSPVICNSEDNVSSLQRPKSAFSSMLDSTVTLNFDLLTRKLVAFVVVPKCTSAESLVNKNMSNSLRDIVFNNFRDARTDGRTNSRKTKFAHETPAAVNNNVTIACLYIATSLSGIY